MHTPTLHLIGKQTAVTYCFRTAPDDRYMGWANCTVNDATGELSIQSDWGSWSYRWSSNPKHLGAATLTEFIATRGSVDYIARKLQNEGSSGQRWSAEGTARAMRQALCENRLNEGREQIANRLEDDDLPVSGWLLSKYDEHGLPLFSQRYVRSPRWNNPDHREPVPYLSRDTARRLWNAIGALADEVSRSPDLFYERVQQIDGFCEYVTQEPWEYGVTEQTPEDKVLRESILPPLLEACRCQVAPTEATASKES